MDEILAEISCHWLSNDTLIGSISDEHIRQLVTHSDVREANCRLGRDELSLAELSTNTARGKVSVIHSRQFWTLSLIKNYSVYDEIVLSPYPTVIIPADRESSFTIQTFEVPHRSFAMSRLSDENVVRVDSEQVIEFGQHWVTPGRDFYWNISATSRDATILLINGPPHAPYTHIFDSALKYVGSSFSSDTYNGRVFFSDLIKFSVHSGVQASCRDEEIGLIKDYIIATAARADGVSEEIWPLVQAMSALDEDAALKLLSQLSAGDHELAPVARSTLKANGINANAG